ncbi:MAG: hypothetical protein GC152_09735 [Alphaproteobacteria bacterium]|nr:hypothetical protein [Alphaproteobacteria bacterium]
MTRFSNHLRKVVLVPALTAALAASLAGIAAAPAAAQGAANQTDGSTDAAESASAARATAFVQELLANAEAALTEEDATDAARLDAFQTVLRDGLALDLLSRFVVSRKVYADMTDDQRSRYDKAFPDYISRQYAEQFDGILGRPLEVTGTVSRNADVYVRTEFKREEGSPLKVDWRTRARSEDRLEIVDIIVNSASIMSVKRAEFTSFVAANGVDALLVEIEKSVRPATLPSEESIATDKEALPPEASPEAAEDVQAPPADR